MNSTIKPQQLLNFWFADTTKPLWFQSTEAFDAEIRQRFLQLYCDVIEQRLWKDLSSVNEILAKIILFDQCPRNMYRGTGQAYQTDVDAVGLAQVLFDQNAHATFSEDEILFAYMPFMHSEQYAHQALLLDLLESLNMTTTVAYAKRHLVVIERFGRFPHRNKCLGRASTEEELVFLKDNPVGF